MSIEIATTEAEIKSCYPVLKQLRPHLKSEDAFFEQVMRQSEEGYTLVYLTVEGRVQAAAGFRFLECLAWGKILYIDDLITDENARKNGMGSALLNWLKDRAKENGCDQVHLDSGPQRHDAHRLYLNHKFKIVAHHFGFDE